MRTPVHVNHLLRLLPRHVQTQANRLTCFVVRFRRDAQLRDGDAQSGVDWMRTAKVLRKVELVRMPALRPQSSRLVDRDARVVADVHVRVVDTRRPLACQIDLRMRGPADEQEEQKNQRGSFALHDVGSHPDASGSFLKCACMMSGSIRYCGSLTSVVTTSHVFLVYGSEKMSKYSSTIALAL